MRKIILTLIALSATVNIYAANLTGNDDLSTAINKSIKQQSSTNNHSSTMVYGGKDISKSIIASADESSWTKKPVLIG